MVKTDRERSLRVEVERMQSELSENETHFLAHKKLVSKLDGSLSTHAFEWEEREKF